MYTTDRIRAWSWVAATIVTALIEWAVYVFWNPGFFLVRSAHWVALIVASYYFGRCTRPAATLWVHRPK